MLGVKYYKEKYRREKKGRGGGNHCCFRNDDQGALIW